ncbi:MAG: Maf family protein [Clostridiales bacterium]|nr:Maf family protein [Clostridiales bacterium]
MIILASKSPRRIELMKNIVTEFEIIPANIDESIVTDKDIEKIPQKLAKAKAMHIAAKYKNDVVIGCDTGVFIDGKMLGKPKDEKEAFEMLRLLSGRTHKVITGCAVINGEQREEFSEETLVTFADMSDAEIISYIATGECADKAGAYGIQGKGSLYIERIEGDFYTVMGLPVCRLNKCLNEILQA